MINQIGQRNIFFKARKAAKLEREKSVVETLHITYLSL